MDGISVGGDVTMQNTAVSIHSPGGLGIACDGTVSLDNTQLTSNGLYAGIDAADLVIKNGCTVNISATEQNCNAAYINSTDSSAGNINISNSAVTAQDSSPQAIWLSTVVPSRPPLPLTLLCEQRATSPLGEKRKSRLAANTLQAAMATLRFMRQRSTPKTPARTIFPHLPTVPLSTMTSR